MSRNIPRPRPGWRSVVCLAPMCCKRARTKAGACLNPNHRAWVDRAYAHAEEPVPCDRVRWGDPCAFCEQIERDTGHA